MDHEPPPESSLARILDDAQQALRRQLTEEVQERETRLLGLLNSIGLPSLDSLEDFIYIHGASKLVPLSSLPTSATGHALAETQSQFPVSPSKRDQRHRDRKVELTALKQELTRVRAELDFAQSCLGKETEAKQRTMRDLDRLLNVAMESQAVKSKEGEQGAVVELHASLQAAYDEIERMDEVDKELTEQLVGKTSELAGVKESAEASAQGREAAEKRCEEVENALVKLREWCLELEREVEQLKGKVSVLTLAPDQAPCASTITQIAPPAPPRGPPPPTSPRSVRPSRSPSAQPSLQPAKASSSIITQPSLPPDGTAAAPVSIAEPGPNPSGPKLSVPTALRRHSSSTAQLSLYEPLRLKFIKTRASVFKNQVWYSNSWEGFVRANSTYLDKMEPLPSPPSMLSPSEQQKDYPLLDQLDQLKVGEVYRELEREEKEMSRILSEWQSWKTRALARHEEVRKLAQEVEQRVRQGVGAGIATVVEQEREGTPLKVSFKKMRRVPGTGGLAREVMTGGRGREDSIDTPSRSSSVVPAQASPQGTPVPHPRAPTTPLVLPLHAPVASLRETHTATPEPEPAPLPPQPAAVAPSLPPATSTALSLPRYILASPPPVPAPAAAPNITQLVLTQTPRKTKRRSDILHLSASGQPASSGVTSTVKKALPPSHGGQLLRDALLAAREHQEGANSRAEDRAAQKRGGEEEDVFAAPAPRSSQPQRGLSVQYPQPESSWEQEPDTQSSSGPGSSQRQPRREEGAAMDRIAEMERPRILVPPSSAEESLSPRKDQQSTVASPFARPAPPLPSPRQDVVRPPPSLSNRRPRGYDTQDLISAAEEQDDETTTTARIGHQSVEIPPLAQLRPSAVGSSKRSTLTSATKSKATVLVREKKRDAPSSPAVFVKAEPGASPPRLALALRNLGGAFGSPPAPAANWAAIERSEKGSKRARERSKEPSRESGKEKKRRKREQAPEEEADVKPVLKRRRRSTETEEDEDEGEGADEGGRLNKLRALDDTNFSDLDNSPGGEEDPDGHHWMRRLHAKRKLETEKIRQEKAKKSAPAKAPIEINPARNGGKDYHFQEVVRNKEARKHMHAHTCEGCAGYYEADERAFDHAANCKNGKNKANAAAAPAPKGNHFLDERHRQMEARLQKTSRHRAQHKPDPEPPDFWQMGFPDTQRVEDINRRAEKDREEKRLYQEAQAATDGFYRYRKL